MSAGRRRRSPPGRSTCPHFRGRESAESSSSHAVTSRSPAARAPEARSGSGLGRKRSSAGYCPARESVHGRRCCRCHGGTGRPASTAVLGAHGLYADGRRSRRRRLRCLVGAYHVAANRPHGGARAPPSRADPGVPVAAVCAAHRLDPGHVAKEPGALPGLKPEPRHCRRAARRQPAGVGCRHPGGPVTGPVTHAGHLHPRPGPRGCDVGPGRARETCRRPELRVRRVRGAGGLRGGRRGRLSRGEPGAGGLPLRRSVALDHAHNQGG